MLVYCQGYSRDNSFLEMVVDIILELKKVNPSLVYGEFANSNVAFVIVLFFFCELGFSQTA